MPKRSFANHAPKALTRDHESGRTLLHTVHSCDVRPLMAEAAGAMPDHPRQSAASSEVDEPMLPPAALQHVPPQLSLVPPSGRHCHRRRPPRFLRVFRAICRTLPIFSAPKCKLLPSLPSSSSSSAATVVPTGVCAPSASTFLSGDSHRHRHHHHQVVTGTLFGYRKGRVSFCLQENPRCLPTLIVELAMQTHALLREMSAGTVRLALECEKKPPLSANGGGGAKEKHASLASSSKLMDEPLWSMFCNGKKGGYGVRREATEDDLAVMETLRPVSMGAGVLPGKSEVEGPDGEMAYVRAGFEQVIGSRDSETLYMMNPSDSGIGPDLTIFFVRI